MNKIMISGLALGSDEAIGMCQCCNFDLSWLFKNPSTLLWADKIILTPEMHSTIKSSSFPAINKELSEAIKIVFEQLESNDILEIKKASGVLTSDIREEICVQIENDRSHLSQIFPDHVVQGDDNEVPGQIFVDGQEYCHPSLWTIYASLFLAKEWDANLFLPQYSFQYLSYKLGTSSKQLLNSAEKTKAFDEVFSSRLPESEILPRVLLGDEKCGTCKNENKCSSSALSTVENNVNQILQWRDYEELYQLREVLSNITNKAEKTKNIEAIEIINSFKEEETKVRKKIHSVFPKVERWTDMAMVLSIPTILAGASMGSPAIASVGAGVAGIAKITSKYLDIAKSKHRWLGFKNN